MIAEKELGASKVTRPEAEAGLIGAVMLDPATIDAVSEIVAARDFADADLGATFSLMVELHAEGHPVNDTTFLTGRLRAVGLLDRLGGAAGLAKLAYACGHVWRAESYATEIRDASTKRRIANHAAHLIERASDPAASVPDILEFMEHGIRHHSRTEPKAGLWSIGDLIAKYPEKRPAVIDGLLRETETVNFIGASKAGKSWLIAGMLLSVASGRQWLGRTTSQGRVLLVDNELHREEISARLAQVAGAMGIDVATISQNFDILPLRGQLSDIGAVKRMLIKMAREQPYRLIALDAFYRLLPEGTSENDNAQITAIYNALDSIASETGSAIALNHHASKGDQSGKSITDVGSGAGAISRAADSHVILRPHELEGCAVMEAVCRSWRPPEPTTLKWEYPVWFALEGVEPEVKRPKSAGALNQQMKDTESDGAVMSALTTAKSKRLSTSQLRGKTGFGLDRINRTIARLTDSGQVRVRRCKSKRTGRPTAFVEVAN